jgi:hypothetical protein
MLPQNRMPVDHSTAEALEAIRKAVGKLSGETDDFYFSDAVRTGSGYSVEANLGSRHLGSFTFTYDPGSQAIVFNNQLIAPEMGASSTDLVASWFASFIDKSKVGQSTGHLKSFISQNFPLESAAGVYVNPLENMSGSRWAYLSSRRMFHPLETEDEQTNGQRLPFDLPNLKEHPGLFGTHFSRSKLKKYGPEVIGSFQAMQGSLTNARLDPRTGHMTNVDPYDWQMRGWASTPAKLIKSAQQSGVQEVGYLTTGQDRALAARYASPFIQRDIHGQIIRDTGSIVTIAMVPGMPEGMGMTTHQMGIAQERVIRSRMPAGAMGIGTGDVGTINGSLADIVGRNRTFQPFVGRDFSTGDWDVTRITGHEVYRTKYSDIGEVSIRQFAGEGDFRFITEGLKIYVAGRGNPGAYGYTGSADVAASPNTIKNVLAASKSILGAVSNMEVNGRSGREWLGLPSGDIDWTEENVQHYVIPAMEKITRVGSPFYKNGVLELPFLTNPSRSGAYSWSNARISGEMRARLKAQDPQMIAHARHNSIHKQAIYGEIINSYHMMQGTPGMTPHAFADIDKLAGNIPGTTAYNALMMSQTDGRPAYGSILTELNAALASAGIAQDAALVMHQGNQTLYGPSVDAMNLFAGPTFARVLQGDAGTEGLSPEGQMGQMVNQYLSTWLRMVYTRGTGEDLDQNDIAQFVKLSRSMALSKEFNKSMKSLIPELGGGGPVFGDPAIGLNEYAFSDRDIRMMVNQIGGGSPQLLSSFLEVNPVGVWAYRNPNQMDSALFNLRARAYGRIKDHALAYTSRGGINPTLMSGSQGDFDVDAMLHALSASIRWNDKKGEYFTTGGVAPMSVSQVLAAIKQSEVQGMGMQEQRKWNKDLDDITKAGGPGGFIMSKLRAALQSPTVDASTIQGLYSQNLEFGRKMGQAFNITRMLEGIMGGSGVGALAMSPIYQSFLDKTALPDMLDDFFHIFNGMQGATGGVSPKEYGGKPTGYGFNGKNAMMPEAFGMGKRNSAMMRALEGFITGMSPLDKSGNGLIDPAMLSEHNKFIAQILAPDNPKQLEKAIGLYWQMIGKDPVNARRTLGNGLAIAVGNKPWQDAAKNPFLTLIRALATARWDKDFPMPKGDQPWGELGKALRALTAVESNQFSSAEQQAKMYGNMAIPENMQTELTEALDLTGLPGPKFGGRQRTMKDLLDAVGYSGLHEMDPHLEIKLPSFADVNHPGYHFPAMITMREAGVLEGLRSMPARQAEIEANRLYVPPRYTPLGGVASFDTSSGNSWDVGDLAPDEDPVAKSVLRRIYSYLGTNSRAGKFDKVPSKMLGLYSDAIENIVSGQSFNIAHYRAQFGKIRENHPMLELPMQLNKIAMGKYRGDPSGVVHDVMTMGLNNFSALDDRQQELWGPGGAIQSYLGNLIDTYNANGGNLPKRTPYVQERLDQTVSRMMGEERLPRAVHQALGAVMRGEHLPPELLAATDQWAPAISGLMLGKSNPVQLARLYQQYDAWRNKGLMGAAYGAGKTDPMQVSEYLYGQYQGTLPQPTPDMEPERAALLGKASQLALTATNPQARAKALQAYRGAARMGARPSEPGAEQDAWQGTLLSHQDTLQAASRMENPLGRPANIQSTIDGLNQTFLKLNDSVRKSIPIWDKLNETQQSEVMSNQAKAGRYDNALTMLQRATANGMPAEGSPEWRDMLQAQNQIKMLGAGIGGGGGGGGRGRMSFGGEGGEGGGGGGGRGLGGFLDNMLGGFQVFETGRILGFGTDFARQSMDAAAQMTLANTQGLYKAGLASSYPGMLGTMIASQNGFERGMSQLGASTFATWAPVLGNGGLLGSTVASFGTNAILPALGAGVLGQLVGKAALSAGNFAGWGALAAPGAFPMVAGVTGLVLGANWLRGQLSPENRQARLASMMMAPNGNEIDTFSGALQGLDSAWNYTVAPSSERVLGPGLNKKVWDFMRTGSSVFSQVPGDMRGAFAQAVAQKYFPTMDPQKAADFLPRMAMYGNVSTSSYEPLSFAYDMGTDVFGAAGMIASAAGIGQFNYAGQGGILRGMGAMIGPDGQGYPALQAALGVYNTYGSTMNAMRILGISGDYSKSGAWSNALAGLQQGGAGPLQAGTLPFQRFVDWAKANPSQANLYSQLTQMSLQARQFGIGHALPDYAGMTGPVTPAQVQGLQRLQSSVGLGGNAWNQGFQLGGTDFANNLANLVSPNADYSAAGGFYSNLLTGAIGGNANQLSYLASNGLMPATFNGASLITQQTGGMAGSAGMPAGTTSFKGFYQLQTGPQGRYSVPYYGVLPQYRATVGAMSGGVLAAAMGNYVPLGVQGGWLPASSQVGGVQGLQQYASDLSYGAQMAGFGSQLAQNQLQYAFTTGVGLNAYTAQYPGAPNPGAPLMSQWGIENAQIALQRQQSAYGLGIFTNGQVDPNSAYQQNRALQLAQFNADWNLNVQSTQVNRSFQLQDFAQQARDMQMQRGFQQQNWGLQLNQMDVGFGFNMTNLSNEIRRSSGWNRRQLEIQQQQQTVMHNLDVTQLTTQEAQQKKMWHEQDVQLQRQEKQATANFNIEMQRLENQKKFFMEQRAIQDADNAKQRAWFAEQNGLQDKSLDNQRTYFDHQQKLQTEAIKTQAGYASALKVVNDTLTRVGQDNTTLADQTKWLFDTSYIFFKYLTDNIQALVSFFGGGKVPDPAGPPSTSGFPGGSSGYSGPHGGSHAAGFQGMVKSGTSMRVGEMGPEDVYVSVSPFKMPSFQGVASGAQNGSSASGQFQINVLLDGKEIGYALSTGTSKQIFNGRKRR